LELTAKLHSTRDDTPACRAIRMADFDADVFDYSNVGFIRCGVIGATTTGTQAISTFGDLPRS
jgi:hypothetical protein